MINFVLGLFAGAVIGFLACRFIGRRNTHDDQPEAASAQQTGLNSKEMDAKEMQAELERQFLRMMQYTGKEQRKEK